MGLKSVLTGFGKRSKSWVCVWACYRNVMAPADNGQESQIGFFVVSMLRKCEPARPEEWDQQQGWKGNITDGIIHLQPRMRCMHSLSLMHPPLRFLHFTLPLASPAVIGYQTVLTTYQAEMVSSDVVAILSCHLHTVIRYGPHVTCFEG